MMNKRQKKKHTPRLGKPQKKVYRDKKPLMPVDWFKMIEKIRGDLGHPLSQKTINMLKRRYYHLYYRTDEQRHLLWDCECPHNYVESKRHKRSKYKLMKRIINELKRVAEQFRVETNQVRPNPDYDEISKVIRDTAYKCCSMPREMVEVKMDLMTFEVPNKNDCSYIKPILGIKSLIPGKTGLVMEIIKDRRNNDE